MCLSSARVRRHGQSRQGRQRWLCRRCGRTFIWANRLNKYHRQFVWFRRWIANGYTLRQLATHSGYSVSTIRRIIEYWLTEPPPVREDLSHFPYMMFDGTFLERRRGIYAALDAQSRSIVHGQYAMTEGTIDLIRFCQWLKDRGAP